MYYDKIIENVLIQDRFIKQWSKAIIIDKTKWPRLYWVKIRKGKMHRRNTCFINKIKKHEFNLEDEEVNNKDKKDI